MSGKPKPLTAPEFSALKNQGCRICMATAYDFPLAQIVDEAGVDGILVGDSLAMVVQGHDSTVPVTLDQIIYHGEMVCRAVKRALTIVDMPFLTYQVGVHKAIENAGRIVQQTGCRAVKLEGTADQADVIAGLVSAGIPVMAHVGLRPQSVNQLGGYKVQRDGERLMRDARAAQDAGAFAIVLECLPAPLAAEITGALSIPTIGIGAGPDCDGQVLVTHDLIGLTAGYVPRFVKQYADTRQVISSALAQFRAEIQSGDFPGPEQTYR